MVFDNGKKMAFVGCAKGIRGAWCPLLVWAMSFLLFSFAYLAVDHRVPRLAGLVSSGVGAVSNQSGEVLHGSALRMPLSASMLLDKPATTNINGQTSLSEDEEISEIADDTPNESETEVEPPWHCTHPRGLHEFHLLDCAAAAGRRRERNTSARVQDQNAKPTRVAFLFLTRGEMPHEALWKRFFQGHEERYSIYVHTAPHFLYPINSTFYGHQVPNLSARRLSMTLVDAMRRLLAYAILDPEHGDENSWFVFLCESTIPIRSFNFTYDYLVRSQQSFVESFHPIDGHLTWAKDNSNLSQDDVRKGEMWMALQLKHAIMVLQDWELYYKVKRYCKGWCAPDEQYIQTLLGMKDPQGIANRTVMYVDWSKEHADSPYLYNSKNMPISWFADIQGRTEDIDGEYHDTSSQALKTKVKSRVCYHNGIPNSPCFLFARKVHNSTTKYLQKLLPAVAEY